ncbi:lytic transglycosylase domain-containing protein [Corallococcus praedator]|uniref:Lytic transglycosylase domain-containing protein n=1 Tax=Corallococcus praedator TaxID=2316724 RepID=A0ABX9QMS8_9BACT|nr:MULTISPECIES: lytic transglycosylase domain-containing protein [Corallococcus]RKH17779.1 lytic transglycosylase domain-containing protein [Corallococcus sp. CA047B]RKH31855.1 lytic transglycosylase domain-containing protein [Corallococcus sp. CA031C]RKI11626.1 lytic transglycosylase domain-containing protein [Corallococcus praedator]
MRGWTVAMAAVVVLVGTGAGAFPVQVPVGAQGEAPDMAALRAELAEKDAQLKAALAKLQMYEDEADFHRAEQMGVVEAVRASGLPERQQRRLAVSIVREAERNNLDPMLVVALIRCESSFNNYAVSGVGAMGLMQVMPDTGKYLAGKAGYQLGRHTNLFDFETNVNLGTAYLAELIGRFGSVESALVAYNAGPTTARKILAKKENRVKFMAGYPAKVVKEFQKLKAQQERAVSLRAAQPTEGRKG